MSSNPLKEEGKEENSSKCKVCREGVGLAFTHDVPVSITPVAQ